VTLDFPGGIVVTDGTCHILTNKLLMPLLCLNRCSRGNMRSQPYAVSYGKVN